MIYFESANITLILFKIGLICFKLGFIHFWYITMVAIDQYINIKLNKDIHIPMWQMSVNGETQYTA